MGGERKIPLEAAEVVAQALLHHLGPHFLRLEIAGSIRRRKKEVGDIEIVGVPKLHQVKNLLGEPDGPMLDTIQEGIDSYARCESFDGRALVRLNDGLKYMKLHEQVVGVQVDLFVVRPPAQWGPIFTIRTGSADFSRRLVTSLHVRDLKCEEGRVIDKSGRVHDAPEEEDFFRLAGVKWVPPERR